MSYFPGDPAALMPRPFTPAEEREHKIAGDRWRARIDAAKPNALAVAVHDAREAQWARERAERAATKAGAKILDREAQVRAEAWRMTMVMRVPEMRAEYKRLRKASGMNPKDFDARARELAGENPTPARWLAAAMMVGRKEREGYGE